MTVRVLALVGIRLLFGELLDLQLKIGPQDWDQVELHPFPQTDG